ALSLTLSFVPLSDAALQSKSLPQCGARDFRGAQRLIAANEIGEADEKDADKADRKADKDAAREAVKETDEKASEKADKKADRDALSPAESRSEKSADEKADRKADKDAAKDAAREESKERSTKGAAKGAANDKKLDREAQADVAKDLEKEKARAARQAQKLEKKRAKEAQKKAEEEAEAAAEAKEKAQKDKLAKEKASREKAAEDAAARKKAEEEKAAAKEKNDRDARARATSASATSVTAPDKALISLLRDMMRSLKNDSKGEDQNETMVLEVGREIFHKALEKLNGDRIVAAPHDKTEMTRESWSSGEVDLADGTRASVSVVWAKRENGLISVTISGECPKRSAPNGKTVGSFIVMLSAKSAVEKGFDIQSQSNVDFWLAKVSSTSVEASCCEPSGKDEPQVAHATADHHLVDASHAVKKEETAAAKPEISAETKTKAEIKQETKPEIKAEAKPETKPEPKLEAKTDSKSQTKPETKPSLAGQPEDKKAPPSFKRDDGPVVIKDETGRDRKRKDAGSSEMVIEPYGTMIAPSSAPKTDEKPVAAAEPGWDQAGSSQKTGQPTPIPVTNSNAIAVATPASKPVPESKTVTESKPTADSRTNQGWDMSIPLAGRQPGPHARIVVPDRAIAGQPIGASIVSERKTESGIQMSFNDSTYITDALGRTLYMVPDDIEPGHSLKVTVNSRSDMPASTIEIFQPLSNKSGEHPRIDKVSPAVAINGILTIDGHNFEGNCERNQVLVDGQYHAQILAASPVQLKV
ncbi:MAG TPA: hypothetical protein V6C72_10435, partial [Chroococcales cyanobacterium]